MGLQFPYDKEVFTILINDAHTTARLIEGVVMSGAEVVMTRPSRKSVEIVGTNQAFDQVFSAMDDLKSKKVSK